MDLINHNEKNIFITIILFLASTAYIGIYKMMCLKSNK